MNFLYIKLLRLIDFLTAVVIHGKLFLALALALIFFNGKQRFYVSENLLEKLSYRILTSRLLLETFQSMRPNLSLK